MRYEYKFVESHLGRYYEFLIEINQLGAEGWRTVHFTRQNGYTLVLMEREVRR